MSSPTVKTRKPHRCHGCGDRIPAGETVASWSGVEPGEGWWTVWMHPECAAYTAKWDHGDWECHDPGDFSREEAMEEAMEEASKKKKP